MLFLINEPVLLSVSHTDVIRVNVTFKITCLWYFDVLLTVHLSIILVLNQLNAQIHFFIISLLYASTCFEHYVLIIRRSKLYYTASGIITTVGGHPVHWLIEEPFLNQCTATYSVKIPDAV